ncbi:MULTISPECIES: hypothetical protein [Photorhabdus]|uniref:Uncharacterized protein n=1 Tax=Photorhabdus cinerea TaxID=471575 RepID=A0A7X5THE0_9GAMM|nr:MULTISPECIES: hypothetical protein [Photorhabdus]NHB93736.1 hypothetical protein [Photorhabdus cinerea]NRN30887.1 hypothetical protein [Photorhabdus heterorhabditis subsp. aluminescens]
MIEYKYLLSLNTHHSLCVARINDMMALENSDSKSGTQSSGFNMTAFVENGQNTMELLMGSLDENSDTFSPDNECEATLTKASPYGDKDEVISHIKLTVDDKGNVTTRESQSQLPNGKAGFDYAAMSKIEAEEGLFAAQKTFTLSGLPDWMWTKARPVSEKNDMEAIRNFYLEISNTLHQRDLNKLWKMSQPAWEEWARAENSQPEIFFNSFGFKEKLENKNYIVRAPDWSKYRLISYKQGRLFRLEFGVWGGSPIRMDNKKEDKYFEYNPYLSIINGKVMIAR